MVHVQRAVAAAGRRQQQPGTHVEQDHGQPAAIKHTVSISRALLPNTCQEAHRAAGCWVQGRQAAHGQHEGIAACMKSKLQHPVSINKRKTCWRHRR